MEGAVTSVLVTPGKAADAEQSSSPPASMLSSGLSVARGTWRAMNDWGDDVERKHFNGDFLKAVREAPKNIASTVQGSIDDVEKDYFDGDFEAVLSRTVDQVLTTGQSVGQAGQESFRRLSAPSVPVQSQPVVVATACDDSAHVQPGSVESLQKRVHQLQSALDAARKDCKTRTDEICRLHEVITQLEDEVPSAQELLNDALGRRSRANEEYDDVWREFEELNEQHHNCLSRKSTLEAELRRETIAADLASRAARHARNEGAWAREGPETEALCAAKLHLAQLLTDIDEARLNERKELGALQRDIEQATEEYHKLSQAAQPVPSPKPAPKRWLPFFKK